MKKKLLKLLLVSYCLLFAGLQESQAISASVEKAAQNTQISSSEIKTDEVEVIKRFNFKNKLHRSLESQIRSFYKDFNKYSEKSNVEKLKSLYSDSFVNNDGFDKETIFKMMADSSDAYKDIKFTTNIEKIYVEENYAVVDIHEFASGSTTKINNDTGDFGLISSDLYYTDYLQKEGNKWKITSTNIKSEKVVLKYGEAKEMPIDIYAPKLVPAGSEYEVNIKISSPEEAMVIGSIVNEQILYPQVQKKDVFRPIKSSELGRILKSNNNGNNEYATVTIGITRAKIEPPKFTFSMTGMAFVMTRINVVNKKNNPEK